MNDAPTPRTDGLIYELFLLGSPEDSTPLGIMERHARTLERELASAEAKAERYRLASLKLDAELARERARLEAVWNNCWLVHKGNENMFAVFSHVCGDYITPWLDTERAAIDAAMMEDAK